MQKILTCKQCNRKEKYEYRNQPRYICSKCRIDNARQNERLYREINHKKIKERNRLYYQNITKPKRPTAKSDQHE